MCDGVHIDPHTKKHFIMGIFSGIHVPKLPTLHSSMTWFLAITDVPTGEHRLRISLGLNMQHTQPVLERPFASMNPASRIYLVNEVKNLPIQHAGEHNLEIEIDDEMLLVTSFNVTTA